MNVRDEEVKRLHTRTSNFVNERANISYLSIAEGNPDENFRRPLESNNRSRTDEQNGYITGRQQY